MKTNKHLQLMVLVVEELVVEEEAVMLLVEAQAVILVLEEVGVAIITLTIHTPLMKDVIITVPTMIIVYIYSSSSYHISEGPSCSVLVPITEATCSFPSFFILICSRGLAAESEHKNLDYISWYQQDIAFNNETGERLVLPAFAKDDNYQYTV